MIDYKKLRRLLEMALQITCPRQFIKQRKVDNGTPFWDQELTNLIKKRNTIMKKVQFNQTKRKDYNKARNLFQRVLEKKKTEFWSKVHSKKDVQNLHVLKSIFVTNTI
jgi:hypothetical protein